ncbi:hypothetical protein ACCO45_012409 [Purpureocillium lilacinum]|uniref:Uncharacterized protein n=1 Tax=Purpureocillium lilacinum TaxID=33203 RepID=A0ACC4DAH3_PURLI
MRADACLLAGVVVAVDANRGRRRDAGARKRYKDERGQSNQVPSTLKRTLAVELSGELGGPLAGVSGGPSFQGSAAEPDAQAGHVAEAVPKRTMMQWAAVDARFQFESHDPVHGRVVARGAAGTSTIDVQRCIGNGGKDVASRAAANGVRQIAELSSQSELLDGSSAWGAPRPFVLGACK